LRTRRIEERTVVAMFMNNRAAETLTAGRLDDAYGWARAAIRHDPNFLDAYNTLGVVYMRRGAYPEAARVFEHVLTREPERVHALSNLADVLARMGRFEESAAMKRRLAQIEQHPPYHDFNQGIAAMKRQDYRAARDLFARELSHGSTDHAVHYWLGVANLRLGDLDDARKHIGLALDSSTSPGERGRYAAKLSALRTQARP
jgi:tetratricopeptide (TPR) repeat protein